MLFWCCCMMDAVQAQTAASAVWTLNKTGSTVVPTGDVTAGAATMGHFTTYDAVNNGAEGSMRIHVTTDLVEGTSNGWPINQIDTISGVYVQFAVTPAAGQSLNISSIAYRLAARSTSSLKAKVYYSTDPTFKTATNIPNASGAANDFVPRDQNVNTDPQILHPVELANIGAAVNADQTFYFRIYPWVNNSSTIQTGKYLLLGTLTITGTTTAATPTCTPSAITPYHQVNNAGGWNQGVLDVKVAPGSSVKFGPQPNVATGWSWTGPDGFTATTREFTLTDIQAAKAGNYVATYTNDCGAQSSVTFTLCVGDAITPHTAINGTWSQTDVATVNVGQTVKFGPWPNNTPEDRWSWSGPNSYTYAGRQPEFTNIQSNQAGTYTATYTNACGATTNHAFTINVNATTNPGTTVAKKVAYVTSNKVMAEGASDPILAMLQADPNLEVTLHSIAGTDAVNLSGYDVIVAQEGFNSGDAIFKPGGSLALATLPAPTVYNKTFALRNTRAVVTGGGTGSEIPGLSITVAADKQAMDLFKGISFTDNAFQVFNTTANDLGADGGKAMNFVHTLTLSADNTLVGSTPEITAPATTVFLNVIPQGTTIGDQVTSARMIMMGMNFGAISKGGNNMTAEGLTLWRNAVYSLAGLPVPNYPVGQEPAGPDATLATLTVNGTAVEGFSAGTTTYNVALPAGTTSATVAATTTDANASTTGTGNVDVTSGSGTSTIVVTAANGSTTKTYTINFTVNAAPSNVATLSALKVNGTTVAGFDAATTTYNVTLPARSTSAAITATTTDAAASASGTGNVDVTSGSGTSTVLVTAADGTSTKTYTINFTVATASNVATLSDIKVNGTTIDGFASGTETYNRNLPAGVTSVTIAATPTDANASVANGGTGTITLTEGTNPHTIVVTAEDGTTTTTYTINFTVAPTAIANLASQGMIIYPNPVKDGQDLNLGNASELVSVNVYNTQGVLVKSVTSNNRPVISISISELADGFYLLKAVKKDNSVLTGKFVKK